MAEELIRRKNFTSSELIDLLATHDTLIKKITCDYLIDKSSIDSNLSLLTANILLRDCCDANPAVRSASLLALSNLPGMEEAAVSSVSKAINDPSPHVRRVAPHCCCNIHKLSPEACLGSGLIDMLYAGIRDSDPIVISNCLLSLETILQEEGGLVINKNISHHLFGKLNDFPDCSLVYVLNILRKYKPKQEEEMFWILTQLDPCLNSSSPSVLSESVELFKGLIKDYPNLNADLIEAVKLPFCKILNQNRPELCYFLMKFLRDSPPEFQRSFHEQYKFFLIKTKDPFYIKEQKFEILPLIASKDNVIAIISELKHYTSDFQSHKIAFKCLGNLSTFSAEAEEEVINILIYVVKICNDQVVAAALECLLYLFIHKNESVPEVTNLDPYNFPETLYNNVSVALSKSGILENHPETVMYLLQFVTPFLESIQDILEELFKQKDTWDLNARLLFVTSTCISFLYSPAAVQPILSSVLNTSFNAPEKELSSHAAFIYAALEQGPHKAFKLLSCSKYFPNINNSIKWIEPC